MTNTYNTGNPLGSTDARDLYDNASNMDDGMNSATPSFTDRLGVLRKTWNGLEAEFDLAQAGRETEFQQFLTDSGFVSLGNYAAGLNFTLYNQYMARNGFFYRPAPSSIPFTTTGTWVGGDENLFNLFSADDVLRQDLANATDPLLGAGLSGFASLLSYAQGTVGARLSKYITVTDSPFNAVADSGVTDNTAAVLAAAIAAGPRGAIYIPPLVGYDFNALMDDVTMPVEVVVFDDSLINGGYLKDKVTGVFEKGDSTAAADTTYVISSGHNAGITLDNTGKSASAGGASRNVGLSWTGGRQAKGAIPGFPRPIAREEYNGSGARWSKTLRKRAPWEAVSANYFRWAEGTAVAGSGEYCFSNSKYYVSTGAGTTGATAPSHTSGSVSDGGVTWTFVQFSYDQGIYSINDYGRVAINSALGVNFRRDRMSVDDSGDMIYSYESVGISKNILLNYLPTDAGGASTGTKQISVSPTGFTLTVNSSIVGAFTADGFEQRTFVRVTPIAGALDTTPSVSGIGSLLFQNASATSVTTLDDGVSNQEVQLVFANSNTTLVHSSSFVLSGAVNVTPPIHSVITMRKVAYSTAWIEVSRSVK